MLASAVGPNLTKLLHDQLDLMLACGLSESLRQALTAIAKHIPPLLRPIQGTFQVRHHLIGYELSTRQAFGPTLSNFEWSTI